MKNKTLILIGVTALLAGEACVSFKIEPRPVPENLLKTLVLCKNVVPDDELLAPVDITSDFERTDGSVICFVELATVSQPITLQWKWYAPSGVLFKETAAVPVNKSQIYLETVTAYDKLDIQKEDPSVGRWVTVILIDGKLAGRRNFSIHGP